MDKEKKLEEMNYKELVTFYKKSRQNAIKASELLKKMEDSLPTNTRENGNYDNGSNLILNH